MKIVWKYWRYYIPTKEKFDGTSIEMTELEFLRFLDEMNRRGQGVWQYFSM